MARAETDRATAVTDLRTVRATVGPMDAVRVVIGVRAVADLAAGLPA